MEIYRPVAVSDPCSLPGDNDMSRLVLVHLSVPYLACLTRLPGRFLAYQYRPIVAFYLVACSAIPVPTPTALPASTVAETSTQVPSLTRDFAMEPSTGPFKESPPSLAYLRIEHQRHRDFSAECTWPRSHP